MYRFHSCELGVLFCAGLLACTTLRASVFEVKIGAVNGEEVEPAAEVAVGRNDLLVVDVWLSHWWNDRPGRPFELLKTYQFGFNSAGFRSGFSGSIFPNPFPDAALSIDSTRSPFGDCGICAADQINWRAGCTVFSCEPLADPRVPIYVGSLRLDVSQDACGTFAISLHEGNSFIEYEDVALGFPDLVPLNVTVGCAPANMIATTPPQDGRVWRTWKNKVTLDFDQRILPRAAREIRIRELLPSELEECSSTAVYGPDISGSLAFSITASDEGASRRLVIQDRGNHLQDRAWYAVTNDGGWPFVAPFEFHFSVLMGDVNDDGSVNANDLSHTFARIGPRPYAAGDSDHAGADVNADGRVNANDLSSINARIVPKPGPPKPVCEK